MKEQLIALLGIDSSDSKALAMLDLLIDICTDEAAAYTNQEAENLSSLIKLMVIERYNKLGNEGLSSVSFSGISENYLDDYSASLVRLLQSKRRVKVL